MADIDIDADELFVLANDTTEVKAAGKKVAAKVASRVRKELARAGVDAEVSIREHRLGNGRMSYDVTANVPDGKERTAGRIFRRAGREASR